MKRITNNMLSSMHALCIKVYYRRLLCVKAHIIKININIYTRVGLRAAP